MKMSTGKLFAASARLACGLVLLAVGARQTASASVWEGGGSSDYFDLNNWDNGGTPPANFTSGDFDILTDGGQPVPVISTAGPAGSKGFWLGKHHSGAVGYGELQVTNGANVYLDNGTSRVGLGNGGTGVYNQDGGFLVMNTLQVALDGGSAGTVNLSGGALVVGKAFAGDLFSVEIGAGGTANVNISGGAFTTRSGVLLGKSSAGTFAVMGSGATQIGIGSEGSIDGAWVQTANGTLSARVDAGGLTKIFIDDTGHSGSNDGNVTFEAGALLDVGFIGADQVGSWDVMQWEGTLTDNGLAFANTVDTNIWSFSFVDTDSSGSADTLRITAVAVPEPASLALMGLGGLMFVGRRRKA